MPQFIGSDCGLVHVLPHATCGAVHVVASGPPLPELPLQAPTAVAAALRQTRAKTTLRSMEDPSFGGEAATYRRTCRAVQRIARVRTPLYASTTPVRCFSALFRFGMNVAPASGAEVTVTTRSSTHQDKVPTWRPTPVPETVDERRESHRPRRSGSFAAVWEESVCISPLDARYER